MPIKTSCNPTNWKRSMIKGKDPICDSKPVVYSEPAKRRMVRHFDMSSPKGYVESVDDNLLDASMPVPSLNETECRAVCALYNHKHLRRNQKPLIEADLAYRKSLANYNICGNCEKPLKTKKSVVNSGVELDKLTRKEMEYADVPKHCRVVQHETNPNKVRFIIVPETRIFNQRCTCGGEVRDMLK